MRSQSNLTINGKRVGAKPGETLIDAALGGWMVIPHDCRSGQCESCRVTVVSGDVDDQGTAVGRTVLACQARVRSDAEIRFDELPAPVKRAGVLSQLNLLAPEILEVVIALDKPLDIRPGQYVRVKFAGYPAREYSPTSRLLGPAHSGEVVLHIRILPDGLVSSQLGTAIKVGHRLHLQGPFGTAFLRQDDGPLVLVSGGAGWAPIWSLARAARETQRHRHLVVIAGSRTPENLYMRPALEWLIDDGVRDVFAIVESGAVHPVLSGRPHHYLPLLGMEDTVYVAGPAGLVDRVRTRAQWAAGQFFADPFLPSGDKPSIGDYLRRLAGAKGWRSAFASLPN